MRLVALYILLGIAIVIAVPSWVGAFAALAVVAYGWLTAQLGGRWPLVLAIIPTLLLLALGLLIATDVDCHPCSTFQNALGWALVALMITLLVVGGVAFRQRFKQSGTRRPDHVV